MIDHVEEEQLQRYFDGELESESARKVAQHLETCAPCMGRHTALGQLHRVLVADAMRRAETIDAEALFARIEQGVRERPEPSAEERAAMRFDTAAPRKKPRQLWVPLAGAFAAAAALLLFLRQVPEAPAPSEEAQPEPTSATTRLSGHSSEVEQVDFGSKAGTVFDVMLGDDVSTPVIWIDDDDDENEL